jgi:hypothetical protein
VDHGSGLELGFLWALGLRRNPWRVNDTQAVFNLAESYERLARAAVNPAVLRRRELARNRQEGEGGRS